MKNCQPERVIKNCDLFVSRLEMSSKTRLLEPHSKYFDMWRGGSALAVAVGHMIQVFAPAFPVALRSVASALAGAAVMIFFVISGFFIYKSISQHWHDEVNWRSYIKARVNRIYPPFAFCIFFTICLYYLSPFFFESGSNRFLNATDRVDFSLSGLWITILHLNNFFGPTLSANGPLWSLAYEVWYYVFALFFALAISGRRIGYIAIPLFLLLSFLSIGFFVLGLIWVGGFMLSLLHSKQRLPKLPSSVFLFCLSGSLLAAVPFTSILFQGKLAIAFQLTFGIWMISHINNVLQKPSPYSIRSLVYSSRFSYTLYVIHFPILLFGYGLLENDEGVSIVSGIICLFFAVLFSAIIGPRLESIRIFRK